MFLMNFSGYYGGLAHEGNLSFALTTDHVDGIYITGNTQSPDLPITSGVHQSISAGQDGFIAKFDINGDLVFSTYFGGPGIDLPHAITVDANQHIYIVGATQSVSGIATANAHQSVKNDGEDAFIAKFDHQAQLIWASYFGGEGMDRAFAIDHFENQVYITGFTVSFNDIATSNAYQQTKGIGIYTSDAFLANFDSSGVLQWATYYGDDEDDIGHDIKVNPQGQIYIAGNTNSAQSISSPGSFQEVYGGGYDCFIAQFNPSGDRIWASYIGGATGEQGGYLAIHDHLVYVAGYTNSGSAIATPNAYQTALGGAYDAFLIQINDCENPELSSNIAGEVELCASSETVYHVDLDVDVDHYQWILPSGWVGESDSNSLTVTVGSDDGTLQVIAFSSCGGISDTQSLDIIVLPIPEPVVLNNNYILSTTLLYDSYQWIKDGVDIPNATQSTFIVDENGDYAVRVIASANDCANTSEILTIDDLVSIKDVAQHLILDIYPNPASDILFINTDQKELSLQLLSVDGRILQSDIHLLSGQNKLSLSGLSSGFYFLKVSDKNGKVQMLKFLKE